MPRQLAGAIKAARAAAGSPNPLRSLRGRVILLGMVLAVTAALMAVGLLEDAALRHRAAAEEQLGETARALSLAVDGEVLQRQAVLRTLAASPALQDGDLMTFETEARASAATSDSWVVLFDPRGKVLIDTAPGLRNPFNVNPQGYVATWGATVAQGDHVGGLIVGRARRRFLIHLDHLIRVHGQPAYDLAMVMTPDALQRLITSQNLPTGWYCAIVDRDGTTLARNIDPARWVGQPAGRQLLQRLKQSPAGVYETVARDGKLTLAGYNRSPSTSWTVAVAMPRYEAAGELGQSLQWLSLMGAVLLVMGGALTLWVVRGMAKAIGSLTTFAESLGRGVAAAPPPTGLAETDFIAGALGAAAERLQARELELHRINETLEARVEEATARLVQSQKIEAIGRLTGGVAHDFNNLLTAVIGNLELLRRKVTDERLLQFVANARSAAERGAKLTAQLLAFARKQTLTREAVDVNALIRGMGELLASSVDGDTHIETHLGADTPGALADRTQLEMVLLNLVINARDALQGAGGAIRISTGRENVDRPPLRPEEPPVGDFARITVADNGVGIAREVMDRIFEPFFTTKPPGRGSGLGLSQALGVAQQLGGGLRIESGVGQGTRVHLYLPVAQSEAATAAVRRPALAGGA